MSKFVSTMIGGAFLTVALTSNAFALEDGWYHAVDVQPNCGLLAETVLFVQSDNPVSGTISSESYSFDDPKKIFNKKTIMDVGNSTQLAKVELSKNNANQIIAKIIAASMCTGSIVTLSK